MSKLFKEYANDMMMKGVALKAALVMPALLLQCPHSHSKSKEDTKCLERRLSLWRNGQISELNNKEGSIQCHVGSSRNHKIRKKGRKAFIYAHVMMNGDVKSAIRQLNDEHNGGLLSLNDSYGEGQTVRDVLNSKHPPGMPANSFMVIVWIRLNSYSIH